MRSEEDFDAGSKYHVAGDVSYIRYFVAHILEYQFYRWVSDRVFVTTYWPAIPGRCVWTQATLCRVIQPSLFTSVTFPRETWHCWLDKDWSKYSYNQDGCSLFLPAGTFLLLAPPPPGLTCWRRWLATGRCLLRLFWIILPLWLPGWSRRLWRMIFLLDGLSRFKTGSNEWTELSHSISR